MSFKPMPRQRRAERLDPEGPLLAGLGIAPLNVPQMERAATPAWAASSVDAQDTPLILHSRLEYVDGLPARRLASYREDDRIATGITLV